MPNKTRRAAATVFACCAALRADGPAPREFAAGVRIDWSGLTVELESEVVMRQGPLELFACSPNTKEHESILRVSARPLHIYQAMGLVGLTPGRPVRYDEASGRLDPPSGERLDIRVRYTDEQGQTVVVAPDKWLQTRPDAGEPKLSWVFAGSYTLPDGRFAADLEGTVLCLVDFEAALIAVPALHSADNEQLWLGPRTDAIPAKGAKCTILIRSGHRPPIRIELAADGTMRRDKQVVDTQTIIAGLAAPPDDARPPFVQLCADPAVEEAASKLVSSLRGALGAEARIDVDRVPCRFEGRADPQKPGPD